MVAPILRVMKFGLYIGSVAGTDTGLAIGKADDPAAIRKILDNLQGNGHPLVIRGYVHYLGDGKTGIGPENITQYATANRKVDLVLCYRAPRYNADDWTSAISDIIKKHGAHLCSLQITEEPNLKTSYSGDGSFEDVEKALRDGVIFAKETIRTLSYPIKVGFNTILSFNPADTFWKMIGSDEYLHFRESVDYVGLDFFPDVFRPVSDEGFPDNLKSLVKQVLIGFRNTVSNTGKIPASIPIYITENGWSTGGGKTYQRQVTILETIVRAINDIKGEVNVGRYELFSLRDADSSNDNLFYQFGIVKDDYTPKPAFNKFRDLIRELTD
jgi:hypothetical protein